MPLRLPTNVSSASTVVTLLVPGQSAKGEPASSPASAPASMAALQSFAAPLVEVVLGANAPVALGQRPYVTGACAVQLWLSTGASPLGGNSRAPSALPRPKPNCPSSSTR